MMYTFLFSVVREKGILLICTSIPFSRTTEKRNVYIILGQMKNKNSANILWPTFNTKMILNESKILVNFVFDMLRTLNWYEDHIIWPDFDRLMTLKWRQSFYMTRFLYQIAVTFQSNPILTQNWYKLTLNYGQFGVKEYWHQIDRQSGSPGYVHYIYMVC